MYASLYANINFGKHMYFWKLLVKLQMLLVYKLFQINNCSWTTAFIYMIKSIGKENAHLAIPNWEHNGMTNVVKCTHGSSQ